MTILDSIKKSINHGEKDSSLSSKAESLQSIHKIRESVENSEAPLTLEELNTLSDSEIQKRTNKLMFDNFELSMKMKP